MIERLAEILAWPTTVVVLGIAAMIIFRAPLTAFLARTKKLGKGGLEVYDSLPPAPTDDRKGVDEFFKTFDNALLLEAEQLILRDLKEKRIETSADKERTLVRALASANLLQHFERIYSTVWLSQLVCLRFLDVRSNGASIEQLRPTYETAKQTFPAFYTNYSFEQWLGYLTQMNLVRAQDSRIHITVAGREFLKYIVATAKPDPHYG